MAGPRTANGKEGSCLTVVANDNASCPGAKLLHLSTPPGEEPRGGAYDAACNRIFAGKPADQPRVNFQPTAVLLSFMDTGDTSAQELYETQRQRLVG